VVWGGPVLNASDVIIFLAKSEKGAPKKQKDQNRISKNSCHGLKYFYNNWILLFNNIEKNLFVK
jgi:hypothetical protein